MGVWKNLVKIYHGTIELQHLIVPKRMALLKEPYDDWKKVLQQCCYNQDWMKNSWQIVWNTVAICEMSKTSWQKGKLV